MTLALIGIQARSGSTRLPRKAFELISGKTMLDHVIGACKKASAYLNQNCGIRARVVVLTPKDDPIVEEFSDRCEVIEGSEKDVLSRYVQAAELYNAEVVARITGDCPLIPSYLISKLVSLRGIKNYDYISNVDPRFRTALDGADVEVMSRRILLDSDHRAKSDLDREHVTTIIRREPPDWAKIGCVVTHFDHSDLKLSVDTPDDLARVRLAFTMANDKYQKAIEAYGHTAVHRL